MRGVVQRVKSARVEVDGQITGRIEAGLLVLVGAGRGDTQADVDYLVDKTLTLRIFADALGKMNLDVRQIGGAVLAVPQIGAITATGFQLSLINPDTLASVAGNASWSAEGY